MESEMPAEAAEQRHPIEFTASGSEYFRIWIVNLLLILVTLGIYLPWAKVRKLKYFYSNTWIGGDALAFHGEPRKMLRGTLIAGAFLIVYSVGSNFSGWAALLAALAFVALWPALFRAAMRFRLANTSWRGLHFHFSGDMAGAYACIMPPLALALLPVAVMGALGVAPEDKAKMSSAAIAATGVVGIGMLALVVALPYFLWRTKRYQHDNYAIGSVKMRLKADLGVLYGIFIKLMGLSIALVVAVILLGVAFAFTRRSMGSGTGFVVAAAVLGFCGILLINILPKSYMQVRLQNLLWSTTGNETVRFDSRLRFGSYLGLQFKNYVLIVLTLGLYWPFAVVSTRRAQIEAIALRSRLDLDDITDVAAREDPSAAGDMAADLFGLDIGM